MGGLIILALIICAICAPSAKKREQRRKAEAARIRAEVKWQKEQSQALLRKQREMEREQAKQRAEQERQMKEQERLAKEQEKQAAQLAKHEEMLMKLDHRIATAEREIAFNREQRERLWKLLEIEELERDSSIEGSTVWQKHHKKVISLENQIHTVQKRIDKAHMDKAFCEKKMSA